MPDVLERSQVIRSNPVAYLSARVAVCSVFFANGALLASWVSRLPAVQIKLHLSTGPLGLALLGIAIGALIGMPLAGLAATRFGSRPVTLAFLLISALALPFVALADNAPTLGIALGFVGFGSGATDVAMNTQAVSVERLYGRQIMSSFHGTWSVGGMVSAFIGSLLIKAHIGVYDHFLSAAVFVAALGIAAFAWMIPKDSEVHETPDAIQGNASGGVPLPIAGIAALGTIAFCGLLSEGAMGDWSAIYLHRSVGASQALAADGYACFAFAMASGRFAGDWLVRHFGPVSIIRSGGLLSAAGLGCALSFGNVAISIGGIACVGLGLSIIVPLILTAAGNLASAKAGASIAAVSTLGYFGFLAGPPCIGLTAERLHLTGALWIVVASNVLVAALARNVNKNTRTIP